MESMRDIDRVMEREIAKGSCPLRFVRIEFSGSPYQEIASKEKLLEVLSYLLRIDNSSIPDCNSKTSNVFCGNLTVPSLSMLIHAYLRPLYRINSPSESWQSLNAGHSSNIWLSFEFDSSGYVVTQKPPVILLPVKIITFPSRSASYSNNACGGMRIVKSGFITERPNTNLPPLLSCGIKNLLFQYSFFYIDMS